MATTTISFQSIRERIRHAIDERIRNKVIPYDPQGYTIVEGFVNLTIQQELGNLVLGGPTIPGVVIVGKGSALTFTFALKALIPDLEI